MNRGKGKTEGLRIENNEEEMCCRTWNSVEMISKSSMETGETGSGLLLTAQKLGPLKAKKRRSEDDLCMILKLKQGTSPNHDGRGRVLASQSTDVGHINHLSNKLNLGRRPPF